MLRLPTHNSDPRWSLLDREQLVTAYREFVEPELRADGKAVTDRPTHAWLREHGFRTLIYTLREHHDTTFTAFWCEDLGYGDEQDDGYSWAISDENTIDALESFLDSRRQRGDLAESSVRTLRSRLNRYVRAYYAVTGEADVLRRVAPDAETPQHAATDAAWSAIDRLDATAELAERTVARIHEATSAWYDHLVRRQRAAFNPVSGLQAEFNWTRETAADPVALSASHVRALDDAATTTKERLLLRALCAWGLRSSEVAALHISQLSLNTSPPFIAFDERKNGPGEVSMLYGVSALERRLANLGDRPSWSGYLFPSTQSTSGHVTRQTIRNWFLDLVARGDVPDEIAGQTPKPQMGRRFWYSAYSEAIERVSEGIEEIAIEQGSSDPQVVLENYLSDERARQLRREYMREQLQTAFRENDR